MKRTSARAALPWIAPALIMIFAIVVWPAIEMVRSSFTTFTLAGTTEGWAGLQNFRNLFDNPELSRVLIRTLIWVIGVVAATIVISLPLAQLLNAKFPGRRFVRYSVIVPWAASVVMTATSWRWILDGFYGLMNRVFMDLGLIDMEVDWLGDPKWALVWLMFVAVFVSLPFTSFVLLAGLQTIPEDIIEAARVDGASPWRTYWEVKFPLLRPALLVSAVINLINVFNSFPIIWVMTGGGPGYETDTTTTFAYKIGFAEQDIGLSASMATINFVIIFIFILLFLRASNWRGRES